ncbi:MAG: hypothetical protein WDM77_00455 [Steroidobacteraceae bacterium]
MKTIVGTAAVAVTILATFTLMRAMGADAPSRPPGVSTADWAPISATMGVVVVEQLPVAGDGPILTEDGAPGRANGGNRNAGAGGLGAALISPISGYLMVKRGTIWQRLIVIEPVKGPGAAG